LGYNQFAFSGGGFRRLTAEEVVTGAFLHENQVESSGMK
jgi:hypothetical protein